MVLPKCREQLLNRKDSCCKENLIVLVLFSKDENLEVLKLNVYMCVAFLFNYYDQSHV